MRVVVVEDEAGRKGLPDNCETRLMRSLISRSDSIDLGKIEHLPAQYRRTMLFTYIPKEELSLISRGRDLNLMKFGLYTMLSR